MNKKENNKARIILLTLRVGILFYTVFYLFVNYMLYLSGFFIPFLYTIPTFLGFLYLVYCLLPRINFHEKLPVLQSNTMQDAIDKINTITKTPQQPVIEFDFHPNAYAYNYKKTDRICIGFPLIICFTQRELNAVIAHEIAHHFYEDTKSGKIFKKLDIQLQQIGKIYTHKFLSVFMWTFIPLFNAIFKYVRKESRAHEFAADAFAARIFGKEAMKNALIKLGLAADQWMFFIEYWLPLMFESTVRIDLYDLYTAFFLANKDYYNKVKVHKMETDTYDTHPSKYDRIESLNQLSLQEVNDDNSGHSIKNKADFNKFYSLYSDNPVKEIMDMKNGYTAFCENLLEKYKKALHGFTWKSLETVLYNFSDFTYTAYQIRKIDDFEFEKRLFIVLISYLISTKTDSELRLGRLFTPVIEINGEYADLGEIILELFERGSDRYKNLIQSLKLENNNSVLQ